MVLHRIAVVSAFAVSATAVLAQTASPQQGREIPAYTLPVPEDISPQMRALVAAPPAPWDIHPKSIAEWTGAGRQGRGSGQDAAAGDAREARGQA